MGVEAEFVHRGRRMFLPVAGVAVLAAGFNAFVYRYRLGHTPERLSVWRIL